MLLACPLCDNENDCNLEKEKRNIPIRGEIVEVDDEYYKCSNCGGEFYMPLQKPIETAFRIYRQKYGMLQPEEIKGIRQELNLTQNELCRLLGWGATTLSRYENGALQNEAHDKELQLAREPRNLLKLIEKTPKALLPEKKENLIKFLKESDSRTFSFENFFLGTFGKYEPSEYSGLKDLDLDKLSAMIIFFCLGGIQKTNLNKNLFYADFYYYKQEGVSISGARYAHLPHGPGLDNFDSILAHLTDNKALSAEEVIYPNGWSGEIHRSVIDPDLRLFGPGELSVIGFVKKYFKNFTAQEIKAFSHVEVGYRKTIDGELISYDFAIELKFPR